MSPKKVAIIGAGPSGLVTAKTLLHNFPHGTFAPVVFDSRQEIGGLWPSPARAKARDAKAHDPVSLDPWMRTNLSRLTVAFSDLSWESVIDDGNLPMFPQARQVGLYLATYAQRYIPTEALRLGSRVKRTERIVRAHSPTQWRVSWTQSGSNNLHNVEQGPANHEQSEDFDYLVVASGYFARPYIPDIPGLAHFQGRIVHSSALRKGHDEAKDNDLARGNIAVLGGSMSGVEAASAFALHRSSRHECKDTAKAALKDPADRAIYHISSRPFWTLPTYLPQKASSNEGVAFLPLDLAMYDLDRRPPGTRDYTIGPIPEEKAATTNVYFQSMLGNEYENLAHVHLDNPQQRSRPPWVAIGNDYAGYVQSGTIKPMMGRTVSIHPGPDATLASVRIETANGESKLLENVSSIVMATGFTPFESLSFLPVDVLSALEYTTDDSFLPLVLDQGGTLRSEIPDVGFVGYYRGPYWGVMEMQARFLGKTWTQTKDASPTTEPQRSSIRLLRQPSTEPRRGQFPMGDYVGLMETFAKVLGIRRTDLSDGDGGSGPVVPARYVFDETSATSEEKDARNKEIQTTLSSLRGIFNSRVLGISDSDSQSATYLAIFRALHGRWISTTTRRDFVGEIYGAVAFDPRYPSDPAYDREYVCEERLDSESAGSGATPLSPTLTIWRLSEAGGDSGSFVQISPMDFALSQDHRQLRFSSQEIGSDRTTSDTSRIDLAGARPPVFSLNDSQYEYTFWFDGVSISSWERSRINNESDPIDSTTRTVYTRI
ncbi:FAD-dependent pyridine nucleotide-disulfide oxidoreductase [Penicillium argentinense]|uniref:FAD-dependent pyridine nucleotide-disulfide oxidoreductase n=1 Tax=Penicillium argentinense TaxID=1131581 RepID=A0A9W9JV33_9EURO|nr:FAD-dependent pyridine nucleotide-disulfide oxidoreductase [Penicillium argentinense]KAJ5082530.1 FAD-dependent pyridine nucleotide-disulfide oxidoreductase [Penicillium argentinense]